MRLWARPRFFALGERKCSNFDMSKCRHMGGRVSASHLMYFRSADISISLFKSAPEVIHLSEMIIQMSQQLQ
jgi:hypothetical protein